MLLDRERSVPSGTAFLSVDYLAPIPLNTPTVARTRTERIEHRPTPEVGAGVLRAKLFMAAQLEDEAGRVLARATTLMLVSGTATVEAERAGLFERQSGL